MIALIVGGYLFTCWIALVVILRDWRKQVEIGFETDVDWAAACFLALVWWLLLLAMAAKKLTETAAYTSVKDNEEEID